MKVRQGKKVHAICKDISHSCLFGFLNVHKRHVWRICVSAQFPQQHSVCIADIDQSKASVRFLHLMSHETVYILATISLRLSERNGQFNSHRRLVYLL